MNEAGQHIISHLHNTFKTNNTSAVLRSPVFRLNVNNSALAVNFNKNFQFGFGSGLTGFKFPANANALH